MVRVRRMCILAVLVFTGELDFQDVRDVEPRSDDVLALSLSGEGSREHGGIVI